MKAALAGLGWPRQAAPAPRPAQRARGLGVVGPSAAPGDPARYRSAGALPSTALPSTAPSYSAASAAGSAPGAMAARSAAARPPSTDAVPHLAHSAHSTYPRPAHQLNPRMAPASAARDHKSPGGLGWPPRAFAAPTARPPVRLRQVLAGVSRETTAIAGLPGAGLPGASLPGAGSDARIRDAGSPRPVANVPLTSESVPPEPAGAQDASSAPPMRPGPPPASPHQARGGTGLVPAAPSVADNGTVESEDDVAIAAGPGSSADTPIARAAQAAVVARSGGQQWPRPGVCRIMTVANQKGGVGKTTTAVNLAAGLAMHGSRVLVIDLDPQGNASTALDVDHHSGIGSVYNVLVEGQPLSSVVRRVEGFAHLYCAPATIDLAGAEIELVPMVARESRLARAVAAYDASDLDYILIDCPPSLGLLTVNALVAAPEVLIPIQCEYYALEGLEQLLRTVELVKSHLNPGLSVTTIVLTMYDGRTRLASQVADEVRQHFGDVVLSSVIPRSVRVSEAPSYGQSVMTYDPGSSGAQAYMEAARELAYRDGRMPVR
jgi:chromosome partitioning protein